jgi:hypothetical protein
MSPFIFTYPNFNKVQSISWYREALTFAVLVKFTDSATVHGSLSGTGFQTLSEQAKAANIPLVELCPCCKARPSNPRWTMDGDVITICDGCAEVEEF